MRQFDLRLPSSAYPAPRGGRGIHDSRQHASTVPPPLISYQRYHIDLNTISCSPSQPHYIALGGAHLHCFLHDRRMIGRDLLAESGNPGSASPISSLSSRDNNLMGQATRCVRKFAPSGQKRMRRTDNGHITACKISDANPNEMIVSWSGDHIYSFDLVRSPDATESESRNTRSRLKEGVKGKARESRDRKRKRKNQNPSTFDEDERDLSSRETGDFGEDRSDLSLRVRYENGQSEDISMGEHVRSISRSPVDETKESLLNDSQKRSLRIAKRVAKIRELMFSSDANSRKLSEAGQSDYTAHTTTFTSILGLAATNITEMDDIMRTWKYPMNPYREDVLFQQTLRRSRDLSRRFVQAAGTLAKVLGGRLQTVGRGPSHVLEFFDQITPAPEADEHTSQTQIFSFEFLRAIVLWLQGGLQTLLQGFKRPENRRPGNARYPVPDDAGLSSIDDHIIPYLLQLAQEHAILNVDASRFEIDENRKIFRDETVAVIAFSQAIKTPLEDLSEVSVPLPSEGEEGRIPTTQDRKQAFDYWGFKVGRSLLMRALEGINFQYVDGAFGGIGTAKYDGGRSQDDNDPDELEDVIESIDLMEPSSIENEPMRTPASQNVGGTNQHEASSSPRTSRESTAETDHPSHETDAEVVLMEDLHNELADQMGEDYDEDEDGDEYDEDEEDDDEDGVTEEDRRLLFKSASDRGKLRESVEKDVPCSSHVRQYRGHCNIQTVKDVNYFGLQDEYVVSGSDSGHVFIWDKKTSELINILEGDEEVVNVVQGLSLMAARPSGGYRAVTYYRIGHPYEPILAVSGIDHTVKIFSPDGRAQQDAAAGVNLSRSLNDSSGYTSTLHPRRARRAVRREEQGVEGLSSRKRMHDQYKIISQNDAERQGGMRDAFITVRPNGDVARVRRVPVSFTTWLSWFTG